MRASTRIASLGAFAIAALALGPIARADIISDEEGQCQGKAKGDACELGGKPGTCVDSTCGFNDYSKGTPPSRGEKPCLLCAPGEAKDAAKQAEPTPAKTDAKPDAKPDAGKTDAKSTPPTTPEAKSGCSIDGALGPGAAALGLALLVLARGARRRTNG